ncbi:MAG: glucose 1-dehydrogenase [Chloroflexi bacterium]|nr:glucose 1-dehydrogenase [Chloroflexota bacterium]MBM3172843.1 glucose 1-dehydrogenase [Chloroflexota bacterium]MBM4449426.1 glucose 1-dehydrogenase [Chloroflexota bacterium]
MDTSYLSLAGKVALVTGGSRGIGRAIALQFADAGADVIVSSRKLADLEKVAEEIRGVGRRGLAVSAHNAKMDELRNLVERVKEEFGRVDILVNNAAANPIMCSVLDMEEPPFDIIMNVNIKGYFFLSQAAAKMMAKQGGGVIINVASVGGISPDPGLAAYCMSKAAIMMMTKAMALELGQNNIRVNAIAPGIVKTRFSQALWSNEEILNVELAKMPLRRISEPGEIARTALYLASDASSFMTGHTVVLDGGANL